MALPIIMHVNYCEQGQTIPEMCEKAVRWGFDGIEFRRKRSGEDETPEQYVDAIAKAVKETGLKHVLFGGPGIELMSEDDGARKAEVEEGLAFYRLAAERLELTVCNIMSGSLRNPDKSIPYAEQHLHGSAVATEDHYAWAAEGFRELGALAQELRIKLAFETHGGYLHDLPEPTSKLLEMIDSPAVGANLDYGNMAYFPGGPSLGEAIETLGERIFMLHLKNSIPVGNERIRIGLGDGVINNREFLLLMKTRGFEGPICIEAPRPGDREWFAQQDLAYVRAVMEDIGW